MTIHCAAAEPGVLISKIERKKESSSVKLKAFRHVSVGLNRNYFFETQFKYKVRFILDEPHTCKYGYCLFISAQIIEITKQVKTR